MWSVFFVGLVLGVLAIVSLELMGLLFVLNRMNRRIKRESLAASNPQSQPPLDFAYNKKGTVWVLESEKAPAPREQKRKKDSPFEVSPSRKHAKIQENNLVLIHSDAPSTTIPLKGCIIEAVSATNLPSRKWAKRFPIKVESKTSPIYNRSKTIYLYLETSWEKESWCQALRLASCEDKKKLSWFAKLNEDFHAYLASLNAGYPSFMKPSLGFIAEPMDKGDKFDGSSKVRLFWRKISKKTGKPVMENKGIWISQTAREDKKTYEKQHPFQDSVTKKVPSSLASMEENMAFLSQQGFPRTVSQSDSVASDADSEQDKFSVDEGTLCWNLLISRIFFDIKGNSGLKSSIQARIQRTLSNMRTPSYIGEVICTDLDIGHLSPYIHAMRLLPTNMNEVWAFEVDAEYSGGMLLDVETRLEVSDQDFQKGLVDSNSESNSAENVSSDLEGFEQFGKHLNLPEEDEVDPKVDGLKGSKATPPSSYAARWKSVVNSVAKQVSQVPLSLSIRVASLRGTLRLYIKPPPSDQLWFGFTSMPDIEFDLESSIGEHKITSTRIALFLISRFKAAIRETMVFPNCECACIPWMLAEKDDWVPRQAAPFIWLNQEASTDSHPKPKVDSSRAQVTEAEAIPSSNSSANSRSLQDLRTPLLATTDEPYEIRQQNREGTSDSLSVSRSWTESERPSDASDDNDSRPKKTGRRARMMDLTKKMGEKFEEKKRHIEERGRHIVEKMRGP